MKKLFVIALSAVILTSTPSVDVSAASISDMEMMNIQQGNTADPMWTDVIEYYYREYKGRLQYRRWNATRNCWVDSHWIYV